jgi:hypothetical protein
MRGAPSLGIEELRPLLEKLKELGFGGPSRSKKEATKVAIGLRLATDRKEIHVWPIADSVAGGVRQERSGASYPDS